MVGKGGGSLGSIARVRHSGVGGLGSPPPPAACVKCWTSPSGMSPVISCSVQGSCPAGQFHLCHAHLPEQHLTWSCSTAAAASLQSEVLAPHSLLALMRRRGGSLRHWKKSGEVIRAPSVLGSDQDRISKGHVGVQVLQPS